ncbi:Zinc finger, C3HC4 type (RING finger) [Musa troglodytarum]|uniref:Zinc finger, C3HC4 type (RING finger) n=1 Tax=Musa troglodytarum TaxID=320322 RepID=A0A9E7FMG4_9LILI|nr:Zinc finger, C3HC4 type (RING finger) [Musa troglodytarum]
MLGGGKRGIVVSEADRNSTAYRIYRTSGNANPNPIPTPPPPAGDAPPCGVVTSPPPPPSSARRPFTSLSQVDADLALAGALQEQERACAMLRMDGVDCSDYESSDAGSDDYEEGVGDEPDHVIEDDAGNIEGSHYTRTLSMPMILMLTMRHSQWRFRILRSRRIEWVSDDHDDHGDNSQDAWQEVDPDEHSYEELNALVEGVGTESRGLPADTISALPSIHHMLPGV